MQLKALKDTKLWPKADSSSGLPRALLLQGQIWTIIKEVKGLAIDGNDRWYKDALGNFLWSGDLEVMGSATANASNARTQLPPPMIKPPNARLPRFKLDWPLIQLDVDRIWPYSMGEGVRIAILDSGIFEGHCEIDPKYISARKNFFDGSQNVADNIGHGTLCAGLISAQGTRIFGVAPGANLLIGKVVDSLDVHEAKLLEGIEWAIEQGAHIISVSLFRESADMSEDFRTKVEQLLTESGVLMLASVGNDGDLGFEVNHLPACIKGVIGVGSYGKNGRLDPDTTRTANLDFFLPGKNVFSLGRRKHAYRRVTGTSMATAIGSGLIALLLAPRLRQNPDFKPRDILPSLRQHHKGMLSFSPRSLPSDSPKPIPNPLLAFQQISPSHVT